MAKQLTPKRERFAALVAAGVSFAVHTVARATRWTAWVLTRSRAKHGRWAIRLADLKNAAAAGKDLSPPENDDEADTRH